MDHHNLILVMNAVTIISYETRIYFKLNKVW